MPCNISKKAASRTVNCLLSSSLVLFSLLYLLGSLSKELMFLHVLLWYVLPTSHCGSHQGYVAWLQQNLYHQFCLLLCAHHIVSWLPKCFFLPCYRNLVFNLHSLIFMKLIKNQKFPKLHVFLFGKFLRLDFSAVLLLAFLLRRVWVFNTPFSYWHICPASVL